MTKRIFIFLFVFCSASFAQVTSNRMGSFDSLKANIDTIRVIDTVRFYRGVLFDQTVAFRQSITLGSPLLTSYGGTGLTSYTQGDIPYYNSGTAFSKLALGSSNQILGVSNAAPTIEYKTLATTAIGTDFTIDYSGSTINFNIPTVSASARGLLTSALFTTFSNKKDQTDSVNAISGYVTQWQKRLDSLTHVASIATKIPYSDTTNSLAMQWEAALRTQNNIFASGTTQTMDSSKINYLYVGKDNKEGQAMYIFPHFRNQGVYGVLPDQRLYIATSNDGKIFSEISTQPLYTPLWGNLRDPSILQYKDEYYIAYTNNAFNTEQGFTIIKSKDLINWDSLTTIQVTDSTDRFIYGPEWYVEGDSITIFFTMADSTIGSSTYYINFSITAQNDSLTLWDSPIVCIDSALIRSQGISDVFVTKIGSTYYMFNTFISPTGNSPLWILSSSSKRSGYVIFDTTGYASATGSYNEGTSIVQIDDSTYRAYYEKYYPSSIFYYTESSDTFQTWTTPVRVKMGMQYPKHGNVLRTKDIGAFRNSSIAAHTTGKIWDAKNDSTTWLYFGGGTPYNADFNGANAYNIPYIGADSLRGKTGSTTYWTKGTWHSGIGASSMGALTVASLTSRGAISGTTGTFSGNISLTNAGTQAISKSVSTQLLQINSDPSGIRGAGMNLYGGTNANEGLLDVFYGNRDSTTAQLGGSFRIFRNSDGTATQMFRIDNLGNFYNRATVWMDSVGNLSNIGTISSGAITSTDTVVAQKGMRIGTSTPAKINSNGSFTGVNKSSFDSLAVPGNIIFSGITTDSTLCSTGQLYLKVSDGTIRRKF